MTALVRYDERAREAPATNGGRRWVELVEPAAEYAKFIAGTEFVPRAMRNNPAAIAAAILYGDEVGVGPMQSLATIAVIEGRPTLAAKTQRALVLAAGHELWLDEHTSTRVTWCGRRAGADAVTRVTWTMDTARTAGLAGRDTYRKHPRQMLSARASAELVGAVFADVVAGLPATEEFDDEAEREASSSTGGADTHEAPRKRRRRPSAAVTVPNAPPGSALPAARGLTPTEAPLPPLPGDELAAERDLEVEGPLEVHTPTDDEPGLMTDAQRRRMMAQFRRRGTADRADRLAYCARLIGRNVSTAKELTTAEADRILDELEAELSRAEEPAPAGELVDEPLPLDEGGPNANS